MEGSTKCPTVLLKADTVADLNPINSKTFESIFQDRTVLQPSSLKMEAYRNNTAVEVLGRFHAFFIWKEKVYRQLFYVINAKNLPNLLSRNGCYTLGVIKPCYSVESTGNSSKFQGNPEVTPTQSMLTPWGKPRCMVIHFFIVEMKELGWINGLIPKEPSIKKDKL